MTDRERLAAWMRERGFNHRPCATFDQLLDTLDAYLIAIAASHSAGYLRLAPAQQVRPPKPGRVDPTKSPVHE